MTSPEWLIADGLGGYAMGTPDGIRTRRYHSLLLAAAPDSERRFVLVNGVEAWLDVGKESFALSTHRYATDVLHPNGVQHLKAFHAEPFPQWEHAVPAGVVQHSVSGVHGHAATVLRWTWRGAKAARLRVRLQLSVRDWHALHHENSAFRFDSRRTTNGGWEFRPYDGAPPVLVFANADHKAVPLWFRNFQYDEERARGQDYLEDCASPGEFVFDLGAAQPEAMMILTTSREWGGVDVSGDVVRLAAELRDAERKRIVAFSSPAARVADQFLVRRGQRRTIIAGYPWFTDWGRDTFISVRGLCIAQGRRSDAEEILTSWLPHLSQGMMPNLFPSGDGVPRYNSVDASLWFVIAVRDLFAEGPVPPLFADAIDEILENYSRGTRHGIRVDDDGLLAAGEPGIALTWMDAVVDGIPVTPRTGKPVEVEALWINALEFAATWNDRWRPAGARARESFVERFWNPARNCLYDVVDVDHRAGAVDDRIRPNQIFACGGLPSRVIDGDRAKAVVQIVREQLDQGLGLRSLGPGEPGFIARADGPLRQRDLAYHQGTAWLWLRYALIDAGLSENPSDGPEYRRWYEIVDGDGADEPRGCPYQAWSVSGHLVADQSSYLREPGRTERSR